MLSPIESMVKKTNFLQAPAGAASTARRDLLLSIQEHSQARWESQKVFESDAPGEGKERLREERVWLTAADFRSTSTSSTPQTPSPASSVPSTHSQQASPGPASSSELSLTHT